MTLFRSRDILRSSRTIFFRSRENRSLFSRHQFEISRDGSEISRSAPAITLFSRSYRGGAPRVRRAAWSPMSPHF
jgi:hypothetical protein